MMILGNKLSVSSKYWVCWKFTKKEIIFFLEECNFNKIVGFYGSYQSRQSTQISICMEYLNGGSLDKMIGRYGRLPEKICGVISASVLDGLDYLKVSLGSFGVLQRFFKFFYNWFI